MFPKRQTKRERLAAIMAEIDTSQIRELPPECDMAEDITASEIGVAKSITITEDGRTMHGSTWVLPQDYSEAVDADLEIDATSYHYPTKCLRITISQRRRTAAGEATS